MSQLEILIPEQWPGGADATFAWRMRSPQGAPQRSGASRLDKLPPADKIYLVLPTARVQFHTVRPPAKNRKKFMASLAYTLEDRIMAEPESLHVAPGRILDSGDLPVAIIDKSWLTQLVERLQAAGIRPDGAEAEALLLPEPPEGVWNMVWQPGLCTVRSGAYSGFELDGGTAESPPPALGMAAAKPSQVQLYSASPGPDAAAWSQATGIPFLRRGEPVFLPCAGAQGIDLLQGLLRKNTQPDWLPLLRTPFKLALAALLLHVGLTLADWGTLKYQKHELNAQMEHSFRNSFPEAKALVNAPLQMHNNLAALRQQAGETGATDYLPMLARVAPHLASPVSSGQASIQRIEYQPGKLQISLRLPEAEIQALRDKLPEAQLESGAQPESGSFHATLTLLAQE